MQTLLQQIHFAELALDLKKIIVRIFKGHREIWIEKLF